MTPSSPAAPSARAPQTAGPDTTAFISQVAHFAREVLAPRVAQWERERRPGRELTQAAADLGLFRMEVPTELGGLGLPFSAKCEVAELLGGIDYAVAFSLINTLNVATRIARMASPSVSARYLSGLMSGDLIGCTALTEPGMGSDFAAIETRATRVAGGWRLDGRKAWITNAVEADVVLLFAQTDPERGAAGVAGFVVDAQRPGFAREAAYAMAGQHAIGAGGFALDGYLASDEEMHLPPGQAFKAALTSINGARTYVAAMCCGMVGEALRVARDHGLSRQTFGQPLFDHQGWRWRLAEASAELTACRLMVAQAARVIEAGGDAQMLAAQTKLQSTRMAERHLPALAQAMGAEGLLERHPFGRHLVAARMASFTDGSNEMLLERIAAGLRQGR